MTSVSPAAVTRWYADRRAITLRHGLAVPGPTACSGQASA